MSGSFESINYSVRPNKCVERKLIFEAFLQLSKTFNINSYRYVGMGSMWFTDFIMAHKNLGIDELVSFELEEFAPRAIFNKPYNSIRVHGESVSDGISSLNWTRESIVWLDYDSGPEGPAFTDMAYLSERIEPGSFLLVTLNAHLGRIPDRDADDNPLDRHQGLSRLIGEYAPTKIEFRRVTKNSYPDALADSAIKCIKSSFRKSGKKGEFLPFMNFKYSDNAPMITIGGIFVNDEIINKFKSNEYISSAEHLTEKLFEINVPPLTPKERSALDSMLPSKKITENDFTKAFGFSIKQKQLDNYAQFYKLYPNYGEFVI